MSKRPGGTWSDAANYDRYVGTWSSTIAEVFLDWLSPDPGKDWLDVGCGTGSVAAAIVTRAAPRSLLAIDRSEGYLEIAQQRLPSFAGSFRTGDAGALPLDNDAVDYTVAGLLVNFLPDRQAAVAEMARTTRPDGVVATYVWDYLQGMEPFRRVWEAVFAVDPSAEETGVHTSFTDCGPDTLRRLFAGAGLGQVEVTALTGAAQLRGFDDYWTWIEGGQGSVPSYVMSLDDAARAAVKVALQDAWPGAPGQMLTMTTRAWAVRGRRAT